MVASSGRSPKHSPGNPSPAYEQPPARLPPGHGPTLARTREERPGSGFARSPGTVQRLPSYRPLSSARHTTQYMAAWRPCRRISPTAACTQPQFPGRARQRGRSGGPLDGRDQRRLHGPLQQYPRTGSHHPWARNSPADSGVQWVGRTSSTAATLCRPSPASREAASNATPRSQTRTDAAIFPVSAPER